MEADYVKANTMLSNLMQRISRTSDVEERNERLQLQNDDLVAKLRDLQRDFDIEKEKCLTLVNKNQELATKLQQKVVEIRSFSERQGSAGQIE